MNKSIERTSEDFILNDSSLRGLGENNKLRPEDHSAHNWYRFVLSFPPHLVRHYIRLFKLKPGDVVLDPFCGTGTTLVECKKLGIDSIGIEANPMACFASQVKVNWEVDPEGLLDHSRKIAGLTLKKLKEEGIEENSELPLFCSRKKTGVKLRCLDPEAWKLLLKNSISPLPLHKTLALLETLKEKNDDRFQDHEKLALAKALVFGIGNLQFGPEVGVGQVRRDAPVLEIWLDNIRAIAADLRELKKNDGAKSLIKRGDSRHLSELLPSNSIDAVITSPPYPNEKDYTRTTRLESVMLGFILNKNDLREAKKSLLRSNTRGVYKSDREDLMVADHPEINRIALAIEKKRIELGKTSGFERLYSRVTRLYFGGMFHHLSELRKVLKPGAQLAYVVGDQASYLRVMIRTGQLLSELALKLGYEVVGKDLFRTRLATATKEQLREEVILLRWLGKGNEWGG